MQFVRWERGSRVKARFAQNVDIAHSRIFLSGWPQEWQIGILGAHFCVVASLKSTFSCAAFQYLKLHVAVIDMMLLGRVAHNLKLSVFSKSADEVD